MIYRLRFEGDNSQSLSTSFARYQNANARNIAMFKSLERHGNIDFFAPSRLVCSEETGRCLNEIDGQPLYRDDDHPSQLYATKIADAVIAQLSASGAREP